MPEIFMPVVRIFPGRFADRIHHQLRVERAVATIDNNFKNDSQASFLLRTEIIMKSVLYYMN